MTETRDISGILGLLDWYRSMGVDAAVEAHPIDWLARGPTPPGHNFEWPDFEWPDREVPSPAIGEPQRGVSGDGLVPSSASLSQPTNARPEIRQELRPRPQTALAARDAGTDARRTATAAQSLDALGDALQAFEGCTLKATASKLCFYRGAPTARLMIIGEAPGRDEDLEGKPFVGRAGQLLDKMLAAIELTEADVHITNVVYWRPPGNRTPTPQETLACRPFLNRQIELVGPEVVLAVGGSAAKDVLGMTDGIMRLRGKWRDITVGGLTVPVMATLHPAYLLRTPAAKQMAWMDLLAVKARLNRQS